MTPAIGVTAMRILLKLVYVTLSLLGGVSDAVAATGTASLSNIQLEVFSLDGATPPRAFTPSTSAISAAATPGGDSLIPGFASGFTSSFASSATAFTTAAVLPGTLLSQGAAVDGGLWSGRAIAQELFGVLAPHTGLSVSGLATLQWTANDLCGFANCEGTSVTAGFDGSLVINDVSADQFGSPQLLSSFVGSHQGDDSFQSFLQSETLSFAFTNSTDFFARVALIAFASTTGSGGVVPMAPVPEPQTYALLAVGLLALIVIGGPRKQKARRGSKDLSSRARQVNS